MKLENGFHQMITNFRVRPIEFSGNLFSLNEELTCERFLTSFNKFIQQNNYIGGLEKIHDSYYNETIYPTNYVPDYLYHYTSINTLKLILKYIKIRLNNLSNVDDLNEGITSDYEDLAQYCFASCWTEHLEENIPFWNMYTDKLRGVRIRLKSNPFKIFKVNNDSKIIKDNDIDITGALQIGYAEDILLNEKYMPMPPYDNILEKVIYTDDPNTYIPKIYENMDSFEKLKLNELGKVKRKEWEFQREWRYIVVLSPVGVREASLLGESWFDEVVKRMRNKVDIGIKYIDLEIDDNAFQDMEVVLGPMAKDEDKIIVDALLDKYNPSVKLKDSVLKGQINIR